MSENEALPTRERLRRLRDVLLEEAEGWVENFDEPAGSYQEHLLCLAQAAAAASAVHQAFLASAGRCECGRPLPNEDSSVALCGMCGEDNEPEVLL